MVIIGLTGGIASGKSSVSRILADLGAVIIDADHTARQVVRPGEPAWHEIRRVFGAGVLKPDGQLDRAGLGAIVFADPKARRKLNDIVHPRVIGQIEKEISRERDRGSRVVIVDAPLLLETGMEGMVDQVWVVAVTEETQIQRLMARDGLNREEACQRIKSQMPLAEKLQKADRIIDNNGSPAETREQVLGLWTTLGN